MKTVQKREAPTASSTRTVGTIRTAGTTRTAGTARTDRQSGEEELLLLQEPEARYQELAKLQASTELALGSRESEESMKVFEQGVEKEEMLN